jgi:hypothetical protein
MYLNIMKCRHSFMYLLLSACFLSEAQADTATFLISELTFSGSSSQNGLPAPLSVSEPGIDGHFVWTYMPGDFQNGVGQLTDLNLPITSIALADATITLDNTGITGTIPGNFHNLTYDWVINFTHALTAPNQSTTINSASSTFDFTGNYNYSNCSGCYFPGEWLGNISGNIIPQSAIVPIPASYNLMLTAMLLAGFNGFRRKFR